jgi:hypothetical protein
MIAVYKRLTTLAPFNPLGFFQRNGEELVRCPVVTNVPTWRVCLQNADGPDPMVTELLAVENGAVEIERPPS